MSRRASPHGNGREVTKTGSRDDSVAFRRSRAKAAKPLAIAIGALAVVVVWLAPAQRDAALLVVGLIAGVLAFWLGWTSRPAFTAPQLIIDDDGVALPGCFDARIPWESVLKLTLHATRRADYLSLAIDAPEDFRPRSGAAAAAHGGHSATLDISQLEGGRPAVVTAMRRHAPTLLAGAT